MTKRNLLLVSLFLVFGFVVMAPCAMATAWIASANTNKYGRVEGEAEETGQVVIAITAGGTVNKNSSFTITYTAPVVPGSLEVLCSGGPSSPWVGGPGTCVGLGTPTIDGTGYIVTLPFISDVYPFVAGDGSQIAVTVRIKASAVTCPGTVSATVQAYTPSAGQQVALSPNPELAGIVLDVNCTSLSLGFDTYKKDGAVADVLTCIGVKDIASYENEFVLNVDEEFPYALTSQSFEWASDDGQGLNNAGATDVTNGSDFIITFSNVPAGVGIKADDIEPCSTLYTADPNYCAGGTLGIKLISPAVVTGPTPPTGGTIWFEYQVTSVDNNMKESVDLSFKFWSHGPLPVAVGGTGINVNIAYAPTIPPPAIPYFTGASELKTPLTVVWFYNCATNLLYPFVTNYTAGPPYLYNNLGTEIFVANTTWDPLNAATLQAAGQNPQEAEGTATPQSGTCTFWLFPNAAGGFADGTAGTMVSFKSPSIAAGGTYGFDMGSVPAFKGLTGYIYAKCLFQNAHGVEYVTDGYGVGEPGTAAAFDAIVIPTPEFYHRTPAGDGLGESAVAPIAVDKFVQKLLFGGVHNAPSAH